MQLGELHPLEDSTQWEETQLGFLKNMSINGHESKSLSPLVYTEDQSFKSAMFYKQNNNGPTVKHFICQQLSNICIRFMSENQI